MAVREEITSAVAQAAEQAGQGSALASKLDSWFEALATGRESLTNADSVKRHLDVIFTSVRLTEDLVEAEENAD